MERLDRGLCIPIQDLDQWMQTNLPHQQLSPPGSAINILAKSFGTDEHDLCTVLHSCLVQAEGKLKQVRDTWLAMVQQDLSSYAADLLVVGEKMDELLYMLVADWLAEEVSVAHIQGFWSTRILGSASHLERCSIIMSIAGFHCLLPNIVQECLVLHDASLLGVEWQPEPPPLSDFVEVAKIALVMPCSDTKPLLDILVSFMGMHPQEY